MSPTYGHSHWIEPRSQTAIVALGLLEAKQRNHRGAQWFAEKLDYPDEEITIANAHELYAKVFAAGREIRITDGGDMLVHQRRMGA